MKQSKINRQRPNQNSKTFGYYSVHIQVDMFKQNKRKAQGNTLNTGISLFEAHKPLDSLYLEKLSLVERHSE